MNRWSRRLAALAAIALGALALWLIAGVGFVNYDTLYALAWGGQLSRGGVPAYGVPIAPTPHPLIELLGIVLAPLGPTGVVHVTIALAFLALSACAWVIYALGAQWFGRAAGALAALLFITRVPVLSYGVRAYIDLPYLLLVLGALLVESRKPRAGWPVLALLALAGLLRPEAWAFSGLYWLYLIAWPAYTRRRRSPERTRHALEAPDTAGSGRRAGPPPAAAAVEPASVEPTSGKPTSGKPASGKPASVESALGERAPREPASVEPTSGKPAAAAGPGKPASGAGASSRERSRNELVGLTLLALAAPLVWVLSDLAITGDPLWSLTNTRHTASVLDRVTGLRNVPEYIPRRIGEILRVPVLAGAALGGVLTLLWLRERARLGALAGVAAVLVFAVFATLGLPINTRYAFLAATILCVFCGAGVFGWALLARGDPRRRWWMAGGLAVLAGLLAYAPAQYRSAHHELNVLARQQSIEGDLVALVHSGAVGLRCGPVEAPNHAPIPLLSLYLKTSPGNVISGQTGQIAYGTYLDPASVEVEEDYVLDPHDPHVAVSVPPGFSESSANRSWLIFTRCAR